MGREWPSTPGEAAICVWEDDKLGAFSIGIEEGASQVPVWLERAAQVGFPATWFIVTNKVGGPGAPTSGTWDLWADVLAKGHDVQSKTMQNLPADAAASPGLEAEYAGAKAAIEANLPGHRCEFLTFPTGKNNRSLAASIYAGARGGVSHGLNPPTRIDYLAVKLGAFNMGLTNDFNDLLSMLNADAPKYYRAWAAPRINTIKDWAEVEHYFEFIRGSRADVWAGKFGDVSKYGQERDTASLTILPAKEAELGFILTDRMMDSRFDYPLTVKVRLPDAWQSVSAMQGAKRMPSRFVRHEGSPYALVSALPDRGPVKITEATSPTTAGKTYTEWLREHWLPADRSGLGATDAIVAADGIRNIEKFALGLDPRTMGYDGRLVAGKAEGGTKVELTYRRPYPRPAGIKYTVEACSESLPWSVSGLKELSKVVADGMETITVRDAVEAAPGKPDRYMRLKVEMVQGQGMP